MLTIEMMAWKICPSYRATKTGEVLFENGIIRGDSFSPLLFVSMFDQLIKNIKRRVVVWAKSSARWMI